jgi:hypothetical protein
VEQALRRLRERKATRNVEGGAKLIGMREAGG